MLQGALEGSGPGIRMISAEVALKSTVLTQVQLLASTPDALAPVSAWSSGRECKWAEALLRMVAFLSHLLLRGEAVTHGLHSLADPPSQKLAG